MMKPLLIVLTGLPGTGKTTLARRLAGELALVSLRVDCIQAPFHRFSITDEGYRAIINIARENLILERGVIIDTVNSLHLSQSMFITLAEEVNCLSYNFEIRRIIETYIEKE